MIPVRKPDLSVDPRRLHLTVRGAVQGVGFRPFVYRLAREMDLGGWVNNSSQGVFLEVEGPVQRLEEFLRRLEKEKPPRSLIQSIERSYLAAAGLADFQIRPSDETGARTAAVLPDLATCLDCLAEILDPGNRRYRYAFTNCTHCGPRYSIIESLPYDRSNTTMKRFTMCADCLAEYCEPLNRRFHAQPNACPACGPTLELWDSEGSICAGGHTALTMAADKIRDGKIVAVKGLGGFHLMVGAASDEAVTTLRHRKRREEKPLALMMPSLTLAEEYCEVSTQEKCVLDSSERPIVILKRKDAGPPLSAGIAPGNPYLGCMLPYTPLHHLLMSELGFPVVATSGNLSDEPICIDENEALKRLGGIADMFLVHNRPIIRHVDDSIVRVMAGREMVQRRARGYAPLPLPRRNGSSKILAVGANLKNTIAASDGNQTFVSQHIGDLETSQAVEAFERVIDSLDGLYEIVPDLVACDKHPDYTSTRFALSSKLPLVRVQHHYAHVLACMAENELEPPVLGIAWDGTGYGDDGTIWGGEFLRIRDEGFDRAAHFRTFPLPGGEKAIREPRRSALGVLFSLLGDRLFSMRQLAPVASFNSVERDLLMHILEKRINTPLTSSVGRLFDAVASMIGLRQHAGFEGQAAMDLEFAIGGIVTDKHYQFDLVNEPNEPIVVDWSRAVEEILADVGFATAAPLIAAGFHNMLAETIVGVSKRLGEQTIALSGGCFQNKYLLERTVRRLTEEGFTPFWHRQVPTNDGGISLGQTIAADRSIARYCRHEKEPERELEAICA